MPGIYWTNGLISPAGLQRQKEPVTVLITWFISGRMDKIMDLIEIRPCKIYDLPYLYEICWKTGLNGKTVEPILKDKFKIGHYFAAPYVHYNKDCCFVATDKGIPKGYIVGTSDTVNYTKWLNSNWLPQIRNLYDFSSEPSHPFLQFINGCIKNDTVVESRLYEYPAHLHIDLLPELQGKGLGRKLTEIFFRKCREKGASALHLGVSKQNPGAYTFYLKMGMFVISESEEAYTMGIHLI